MFRPFPKMALVVATVGLLGAGGSPLHAPALQAAIDRRAAAVAKAKAAYEAAVLAADQQLAKDVQPIQRRAMAANDLTGANDAAAVIQSVERPADPAIGEQRSSPIESAQYGTPGREVDVLASVRKRLAAGQDVWVDANLTDGRPATTGDLRLTMPARDGKTVTVVARQGSRLTIAAN